MFINSYREQNIYPKFRNFILYRNKNKRNKQTRKKQEKKNETKTKTSKQNNCQKSIRLQEFCREI